MLIEPGQMLSHYRLTEKIGEGGMGIVWKAEDIKLGRDVAIKLLPEELTADPERLARFEREARVLASLNHPHIAAIYDVDHDQGTHFLVLELVEGQDLTARMDRGKIPADEAAGLALQIAMALEAAHESQIVHRDLKPANVKLTPDGRVKVLDFGLAKVHESEGTDSALSFSPTLTARMTQAGVILGTAAYMSPEQARGKAVDKRSDIWAFGVLLYEMLSGTRLFAGETATDILGAIVHRAPDWERLPAETPPGLVRLLKRCLTQELPERLRDIGEARHALTHLGDEAPIAVAGESAPATTPWPWKLAAGLLLVAATVLAVVVMRMPAAEMPVLRATVPPPLGYRLICTRDIAGPVAVSPDGRSLAFVAGDQRAGAQVWVRALDAAEARPIAGTEGAQRPFWSPDSRSLGFFSHGKLRRVALDGGAALAVADAPDGRGGSWSPEGVIVFAPTPHSTLLRVAAGGGEASKVTELQQTTERESSHREPRFLPDGRHFLYLALLSDKTEWRVYVGDLDGSAGHLVGTTSGGIAYADGYLLTLRGQTLVAQAFDPDTFALSGDPMPLTEDVTLDAPYGIGVFSAVNGVLAYQAGSQTNYRLTWLSADGQRLEVVGPAAPYDEVAVSPDGTRAAVTIQESDGIQDVWMIDLAQGTRSRFTFSTKESPAVHENVIWSPDGREIIFTSNQTGTNNLFRKPADGVGKEQVLLDVPENVYSYDWSPDGRYVVYGHEQPEDENAEDLFAMPVSGEGETLRVTDTPVNDWPAKFSPDGRWLAYESAESGRHEIYVVPFPALDSRWQVSSEGGRFPRWSPDGRRMYFWNDGVLMTVPVRPVANTLQIGAVEPLMDLAWAAGWDPYDQAPDGKRFMTLSPEETHRVDSISLFLNWRKELESR